MAQIFQSYFKKIALYGLVLAIGTMGAAQSSQAAPEYIINIENHKFSPSELEIPADQKVKLTVINKDPTAEEFESYELKREKVIAGGKQAVIYVGPLEPGTYPFFGEFNQSTAQGKIIVK